MLIFEQEILTLSLAIEEPSSRVVSDLLTGTSRLPIRSVDLK